MTFVATWLVALEERALHGDPPALALRGGAHLTGSKEFARVDDFTVHLDRQSQRELHRLLGPPQLSWALRVYSTLENDV